MSELEAVYRNTRADAEILRLLDQELGHRTTKRASRLRAAVVKARAGRLNSGSGVPPTGGGEGPRTTGSAGVISLPPTRHSQTHTRSKMYAAYCYFMPPMFAVGCPAASRRHRPAPACRR